MKKYYIFAAVLVVYTLAMMLVGFSYVGNPFTLSRMKRDQQRVATLYDIKNIIRSYAAMNSKLPSSLEEAKVTEGQLKVFKDSKLDYKIVSNDKYQLCTTFEYDASKENKSSSVSAYPYYNDAISYHGVGYQCVDYFEVFPVSNSFQNSLVPTPALTVSSTVMDPYTYKGDSDPINDKVQVGTLESKSTSGNPPVVSSFYLTIPLVSDAKGIMLFLLDENSKVLSGDTPIMWSDIRIGDRLEVTYGKTSNGADYARIVKKLQ